jgi:catechol 2,3-dioxygenase-like lactoylglutathione lyase family enzyme
MSDRTPSLAQLGLCTNDMASTIRLYTEAFGFADAGAHVFWGRYLADLQRLDKDATCITWWMVGRQARLQLEFFQHTKPPQRPLVSDWRPSDLGWVRWGLAVPDVQDSLNRLRRSGVAPTTDRPDVRDGLDRWCVRDPGTGLFLELIQEGPEMPGGIQPRANSLMPAVVYATVSVADLDRALSFYVGVLGLRETDVQLHGPDSESLWGLDGAKSESRVLAAGDSFVEVVQYLDPAPRDVRHALSDQGFMNAGFLARDQADFEAILARAAAAGLEPNLPPPERPNTEAYLTDTEGTLSEVMLVPREFEAEYGFVAKTRFPPPRPWPEPRVPPHPC